MSQHVSEAGVEEGGQHSQSLSGVSRAGAKYLYYTLTQTHPHFCTRTPSHSSHHQTRTHTHTHAKFYPAIIKFTQSQTGCVHLLSSFKMLLLNCFLLLFFDLLTRCLSQRPTVKQMQLCLVLCRYEMFKAGSVLTASHAAMG